MFSYRYSFSAACFAAAADFFSADDVTAHGDGARASVISGGLGADELFQFRPTKEGGLTHPVDIQPLAGILADGVAG
jgi:hypothetical protein